MNLEKGMVFEIKNEKYLILEIAKHSIDNKEYVVYKNVKNDIVLCLEKNWFKDVKIWGV